MYDKLIILLYCRFLIQTRSFMHQFVAVKHASTMYSDTATKHKYKVTANLGEIQEYRDTVRGTKGIEEKGIGIPPS